MRVNMVKQILILLILLGTCFWGRAGNNNNCDFHGDISSPAIRNNIKFNYDLIAGINNNEQINFSDDFNLPELRSLWCSNVDESDWTLKERPGFLRIKAQKVNNIDDFLTENTFFQKLKNNSAGEVISCFDLSNLTEGSYAGLYFNSKRLDYIGIEANKDGKRLIAKVGNEIFQGPFISEDEVMLRVTIENAMGRFEYSFDGLNYARLGSVFQLSVLSNDFIGIYCLNDGNGKGSIDIDWFYYNPHNVNTTKFAEKKSNSTNSEL